jgi:hypothetical protein
MTQVQKTLRTVSVVKEARTENNEGFENSPDTFSAAERLKLAMSVMEYNQSFVTFADGKANALLLINSIFLATTGAAGASTALSIVTLASAALAILCSLGVVYARLPGIMKRDRAKVVFWGHIRQRRSKAEYLADFLTAKPQEVCESLIKQTYDVADVVERKFKAYHFAQMATFLSAVLWVANLLRGAVNI